MLRPASSALMVLLAASASYGAGAAAVYKCTDAGGRKVYQDRPCSAGQPSAPYDLSSTPVTTIDSGVSRREAQEALMTRAAGPAADDGDPDDREARVPSEPDYVPVPVYPPQPVYYPYPVYRDHHRHDRPRVPHRPDPTPMRDPPRTGGGYVPAPPTIRDVAPRPPSSSREARQP